MIRRKQYSKEFKPDTVSLVLEQEEIRKLKVRVKQLEMVREIAESSDNTYCSCWMRQVLNARSYPASRSKTRKFTIEAGVQAKQRKRYKVTANSNHR